MGFCKTLSECFFCVVQQRWSWMLMNPNLKPNHRGIESGLERRGPCQVVVDRGARRSGGASDHNNFGPVGRLPCQQGRPAVRKKEAPLACFKIDPSGLNLNADRFICNVLAWWRLKEEELRGIFRTFLHNRASSISLIPPSNEIWNWYQYLQS